MKIELKRNPEDIHLNGKYLVIWLVIFLVVGSCIWKAIDTSPAFKNHHNHLCDTCEAKGHWSPATEFFNGWEWCSDCASKHMNQAIIDASFHSN